MKNEVWMGLGGRKEEKKKARMRKSREKEIRKERSKGNIKYIHTDGRLNLEERHNPRKKYGKGLKF